MNVYDKVKLTSDDEKYIKQGLYKGMTGRISVGEIRQNEFLVAFDTGDEHDWYNICEVNVADLELVESFNTTEKQILEELPKQDPRWWCKVEDGYILNLLGDKKNKIPYDYNS